MTQQDVERASRGDHDAFERIVIETLPSIFGTARHILGDDTEAQDAVQEALVRAWQWLPSLRAHDRFNGWLYRILMRAIADQVRKRSRFDRHASESALRAGYNTTDGRSLSDDVSERHWLAAALSRLTIEQRTVLVLIYYRGFQVREVGAMLGIPIGTVKSRLSRALAAMRHELFAPTASPSEEA
jgi:RNA polymerase sigma-70 factor, ECF subfamily